MMMSMTSLRRLEEESLSELEVAFLESVEPKRENTTSSTSINHHHHHHRRRRRESLAKRVQGSLVQWRSRWVSQLEEMKEQLVHKLVCCAHDVDACMDEEDDEEDDAQLLEKGFVPAMARKDTTAKSSASIVPVSAAIQRPADTQAMTVALAPVVSAKSATTGLDDISYMLDDTVDSEGDAAIKIQRMVRCRSASRKSLLMIKERGEDERNARASASFSRVRLALRCLFTMKKLAEERRHRVAVIAIQRNWRRFHEATSAAAPPPLLEAAIQLPAASMPSRLHTNRKRSRAIVEDEVLGVPKFDEDVSVQESNLRVSESLEREHLLVAKRSASVPPPITAIRPIAIKSRAVVQTQAVCVIQSAWRCAMAKQHANALRRLSAYEQECRSVMPAVRSQMSVVRQRLSELRRRSGSDGGIEFDDEWL